MKSFALKIQKVERQLARKYGAFHLFALLRREDSEWWDLLFVARWADQLSTIKAIGKVVVEIRALMGERALLQFSKVMPLPVKTPALNEIYRRFSTKDGLVEVDDEHILGLEIKKGYIITAQAKLPTEVQAAVLS